MLSGRLKEEAKGGKQDNESWREKLITEERNRRKRREIHRGREQNKDRREKKEKVWKEKRGEK